MDNRSLCAKFQVHNSLRSDSVGYTTDGRIDRHSSNVLEFYADQTSPRNLVSIFLGVTRIDYEEGIKIIWNSIENHIY